MLLRVALLVVAISVVSGLGFYGADMPGNDLKTVVTSSDLNCAIECDKLSTCKCWSWDTGGSGNCWLKSATSNRVAANNRVFGVKLGENVDRIGGDMPGMPLNLGSATASSCAAQCQATAGCVAWSFDSCGKSSCWLKSSIPTGTSANSCRLSAIQGNYNVDRSGGDITSVVLSASATATDCNTQCANTPGCSSWSMVQPGVGCELQNTCWLKNSANLGTSINNCRVSAALGSNGGGGGGCPSGAACFKLINNCNYNIDVFDGQQGRVVKTLTPLTNSYYTPANPSSFNLFKKGGGTWAEFSMNTNNFDSWDISVFRGYDGTPLTIITNAGPTLTCNRALCPDAYDWSTDDTKSHVVPASPNHYFYVQWC